MVFSAKACCKVDCRGAKNREAIVFLGAVSTVPAARGISTTLDRRVSSYAGVTSHYILELRICTKDFVST